jgi:hypothetical protein
MEIPVVHKLSPFFYEAVRDRQVVTVDADREMVTLQS